MANGTEHATIIYSFHEGAFVQNVLKAIEAAYEKAKQRNVKISVFIEMANSSNEQFESAIKFIDTIPGKRFPTLVQILNYIQTTPEVLKKCKSRFDPSIDQRRFHNIAQELLLGDISGSEILNDSSNFLGPLLNYLSTNRAQLARIVFECNSFDSLLLRYLSGAYYQELHDMLFADKPFNRERFNDFLESYYSFYRKSIEIRDTITFLQISDELQTGEDCLVIRGSQHNIRPPQSIGSSEIIDLTEKFNFSISDPIHEGQPVTNGNTDQWILLTIIDEILVQWGETVLKLTAEYNNISVTLVKKLFKDSFSDLCPEDPYFSLTREQQILIRGTIRLNLGQLYKEGRLDSIQDLRSRLQGKEFFEKISKILEIKLDSNVWNVIKIPFIAYIQKIMGLPIEGFEAKGEISPGSDES